MNTSKRSIKFQFFDRFDAAAVKFDFSTESRSSMEKEIHKIAIWWKFVWHRLMMSEAKQRNGNFMALDS